MFAILAGVMGIGQMVPYALSSFRGITKPSRAAAVISVASNLVVLLSMAATGARAGLVMPIAFAFTGLLTLGLAVKYGHSGFTKLDRFSATVAGASLIAFWLVGPLVALVALAVAQSAGVSTVWSKLRRHPGSEDRVAWVMVFLSAVFTVLAILAEGVAYPAVLFVPAVSMVAFGAVLSLILVQHRMATVASANAGKLAPAAATPALDGAGDLALAA